MLRGFGGTAGSSVDANSDDVTLSAFDLSVFPSLWEGTPLTAFEALASGKPIVATNLHAYSMPFIRYSLGDIVTRGSNGCSCGQPFQTIRAIQGLKAAGFDTLLLLMAAIAVCTTLLVLLLPAVLWGVAFGNISRAVPVS